MNYKVCILASDPGTKMGELGKNTNIAVLPLNFKATISYIIEKFPENVEIVIAVGHKKETVIDYLALAYPERKFTFVELDKSIGHGTGPGYSLLSCKNYLQCPFIFFVSDTIVLEEIPAPDINWCGIAPVKETEPYCTVKIKNNLIYQFDDKIKCDNKYAFLGLAGIKDYDVFWNALERSGEIYKDQIRDIPGFKALIEKRLTPVSFTWFDAGSLDTYAETNKHFSGGEKHFDFSKNDEFLYFINGKVIKFFADSEITRKRVERAKYLKGLCPEINGYKGNFFCYNKKDGQVLYNSLNSEIFKDFLHWSRDVLWIKPEISDDELKEFYDACKKFYYDKTMKRLESFYSKNNITDRESNINGVHMPPLKELLEKIDFDYISKGIPVRFHGDFVLANILITRDIGSLLHKFTLLDWRHDFGGLTKVGDIYYDLAKLYKGIILSDELIKNGMFSFDMSGSSVYYDYFSKNQLVEAKEEYEMFLKENGFDLNKVKIIAALALLNMSPLHKEPFNFLVYYLGKNILYKTLKQMESSKKSLK
jgi:NDP-sugar pyrophosphorylase family protein